MDCIYAHHISCFPHNSNHFIPYVCGTVVSICVEMEAQGSRVAQDHTASKCRSWNSDHGAFRAGVPNLHCVTCLLSKLSGLSVLLGDYVSDPDLVQSSLASTVAFWLVASSLCQLNCQSLVRLSANPQPPQTPSRDPKLPAGVGRLVWRCAQTIHQKHPSVAAFLALRGHIKNMV